MGEKIEIGKYPNGIWILSHSHNRWTKQKSLQITSHCMIWSFFYFTIRLFDYDVSIQLFDYDDVLISFHWYSGAFYNWRWESNQSIHASQSSKRSTACRQSRWNRNDGSNQKRERPFQGLMQLNDRFFWISIFCFFYDQKMAICSFSIFLFFQIIQFLIRFYPFFYAFGSKIKYTPYSKELHTFFYVIN